VLRQLPLPRFPGGRCHEQRLLSAPGLWAALAILHAPKILTLEVAP
jgi:hypothetical protein